MKPSNRTTRVAQQMQMELAKLIPTEVKDPRLGMVTVTGVEVTRDFAHAKIYVVIHDDKQQALKILNGAAKHLRRCLAREMLLRIIPELHFHSDDSAEYGSHIDELLRKIDE